MLDRSKLAVLVQTHVGHRRFLKASLESCRKLNPAMVICAYNTNVPMRKDDKNFHAFLPASDVLACADKWIFQSLNSNIGAWFTLQATGLAVIDALEIEWVFSNQGDCVLFNPEGFDTIYDMLQQNNGDIISASNKGEGNFIGTISYLSRTKTALEAVKLGLSSKYVGDRSVEGKGCEVRFGRGLEDIGAKKVAIENPDNIHFSYEPRGTWGDILGFVHAHGTEKWRKVHKHEPLPKWVYDERYLRPLEVEVLNHYWSTGDTNHFVEKGYWPEEPVDGGEYVKTKHELNKIGRPDSVGAVEPLVVDTIEVVLTPPKVKPVEAKPSEITVPEVKILTPEEKQILHEEFSRRRKGYQPVPGYPNSKSGGEEPFQARLDAITKVVGIDKSYLNLGSNIGYEAFKIVAGGGRVLGVDKEQDLIEYCNNKLKPYFECTKDNPIFIHSDVFEYMNSNTDKFDCVLCLMLIHNLLKKNSMKTVLEFLNQIADITDCMVMQHRPIKFDEGSKNIKYEEIPQFIVDNTKFNSWEQIADGKDPVLALGFPLWILRK